MFRFCLYSKLEFRAQSVCSCTYLPRFFVLTYFLAIFLDLRTPGPVRSEKERR